MSRVLDAIAKHAADKPDAVALSDDTGTWSFAELGIAVAEAARSLTDLCEDGRRPVAVKLPNSAAAPV